VCVIALAFFVWLQELEENGQGTALTAQILKILYATAEGFEPIDESVANNDNANGEAEGGNAPAPHSVEEF
jgi:hypothetical protein